MLVCLSAAKNKREPIHVLANPLVASALVLASTGSAWSELIHVKVFVGSMFEIGENTGDCAGEYQHCRDQRSSIVTAWSQI